MLKLEIKNHKTTSPASPKISPLKFNKILKTAQTLVPKIKNLNGTIELNFISKTEMQRINKTFRKIDKPTDVLSFSYFEEIPAPPSPKKPTPTPPPILAEIFICTEVAKTQSLQHANSLTQELLTLFTHGLLHIFGYTHDTDGQEKEMQEMADKLVAKFNSL